MKRDSLLRASASTLQRENNARLSESRHQNDNKTELSTAAPAAPARPILEDQEMGPDSSRQPKRMSGRSSDDRLAKRRVLPLGSLRTVLRCCCATAHIPAVQAVFPIQQGQPTNSTAANPSGTEPTTCLETGCDYVLGYPN